MRRRLAWCNSTGQRFDEGTEQYSIYPRAISDASGMPHRGSKSVWTSKLEERYSQPAVVTNGLPVGWNAQAVIIDGMFLVNTTPLRRNRTIDDYSKMLLGRFAIVHYKAGTAQVHIIFDKPIEGNFLPKMFERQRRDVIECNHMHIVFTPDTPIPNGWRKYIDCRQCKRSIIEAVGAAYLRSARFMLFPNQILIISGCFSGDGSNQAWVIKG